MLRVSYARSVGNRDCRSCVRRLSLQILFHYPTPRRRMTFAIRFVRLQLISFLFDLGRCKGIIGFVNRRRRAIRFLTNFRHYHSTSSGAHRHIVRVVLRSKKCGELSKFRKRKKTCVFAGVEEICTHFCYSSPPPTPFGSCSAQRTGYVVAALHNVPDIW